MNYREDPKDNLFTAAHRLYCAENKRISGPDTVDALGPFCYKKI